MATIMKHLCSMNLNFIEEMWVWVPIKKYVRDDVDSVSEHGGHHSADTSSALMKLKTSFPFDHTPFHTRNLLSDLFWNDEHHCFLRGLCFGFWIFCLASQLHSFTVTQSNVCDSIVYQSSSECVYLCCCVLLVCFFCRKADCFSLSFCVWFYFLQ